MYCTAEKERESESKATGLIAAIKHNDIMNGITWAAWAETLLNTSGEKRKNQSVKDKDSETKWKRVIW